MGVSDGQVATGATFNAGLLSKNSNDTKTGNLGLNSPDVNAGDAIADSDGGVQRFLNAVKSAVGIPLASIKTYILPWSTNIVGNSTDTVKERGEFLTLKFRGTAGQGHAHAGTDGDSEKVDAANLKNVNNFFGIRQEFTKTGVTGGSADVSAVMSGRTAGGGSAVAGVVTSAPYNRCILRDNTNGDFFEDADGDRILGLLTESGGTWTLTFVSDDGSDTPYSFAVSTDMKFYPIEVFNQNTRPTLAPDVGVIGSSQATSDVVDATGTIAGKVSTTAQTFGGAKTFLAAPILDSLTAGAVLFLSAGKAVAAEVTKFFWDATNFRLGVGTNSPAVSLDVSGDTAERRFAQATTATITALDTAGKSFIGFTGSTATELQGIANGADGKNLELHNEASAAVTIKHENAGASAANRIYTPDGLDFSLPQNKAVRLKYNATLSRWLICKAPNQSPLTTKGDLWTFSTVDARLGVGTDGYVLQADSTQTTGLKWAAPGSTGAIPTGIMMDYAGAAAPSGWVLASGRTIGSVASSATERANADTETLFTLLWLEYSNSLLPIEDSTGTPTTRGVSAAADFAANKRMPLLDMRGRVAAGKDDMGGTAANRLTSGGSGIAGTTLGASGGTQTHTMVSGEMPSHTHVQDAHGHYVDTSSGTATYFALTLTTGDTLSSQNTHPINATTATNQNTGGGGAHQNTQPTMTWTKIIKL